MSLFTESSLCLVPSGVKVGKVYSIKPTDGSGDLTFTRSNDTATRIAPNGLLEKVRTNLAWPSEDFTTNWVPKNGVVTANTTANPIDGAITADTFTVNAAVVQRTGVEKNFTASVGEVTASTYFKHTNNQWVFIAIYDTNNATYRTAAFDIQNGVVGVTSSGATSTITSAGNGFYRCSITYPIATSTNIYHSQGVLDSNITGVVANVVGGESFITFGAQLEQGVLTDYIATTSAAVSVGPVANVPRLDYLNSSCPRLLLEPQRTNLAIYSEQMNNTAWVKVGTTITANNTTSPDGYTNADKIIPSTTGTNFAYQNFAGSGTQTNSFFVKAGGKNFCWLLNAAGNTSSYFNLANGTVAVNASGTAKIESFGNGWYRISETTTSVSGNHLGIGPSDVAGNANSTVNGTDGIFVFGGQNEAGAYATSYIGPTLGAAVTRGSDYASKTGISSLIGQTEGTLYWEGVRPEGANDTSAVSLSDTTTNNEVTFRFTAVDTVEFYLRSGGGQTVASTYTGADLNQNTKIAFAYKANDVAVYVNGTLVVLDTSATVPASLTAFKFSRGNDGTPMIASVSQALLFKTRLSNADLAALTA